MNIVNNYRSLQQLNQEETIDKPSSLDATIVNGLQLAKSKSKSKSKLKSNCLKDAMDSKSENSSSAFLALSIVWVAGWGYVSQKLHRKGRKWPPRESETAPPSHQLLWVWAGNIYAFPLTHVKRVHEKREMRQKLRRQWFIYWQLPFY